MNRPCCPSSTSNVKAEKFSIYNPTVQAKHPLNGLKLTNSTDLHLMQGPITVFDGDTYAGDAMIHDIPPGSERLISYALDLDTEVAPESKSQPRADHQRPHRQGHADHRPQVHPLAGVHGEELRQEGQEGLDRVRPRSELEARFAQGAGRKDPRQVPLRGRCQAGRAGQADGRGRADRAPGGRPDNLDDNTISFYIRSDKVSEKVKAALTNVVKQKQAIQDLAQKRGQLEQDIRTISEDQPRIRENMGKLDQASDLYKRVRQEVLRPGGRDREAPPADQGIAGPREPAPQVAGRLPARAGGEVR